MNSNDINIYEIIEQYLSGTLPESQKALFEEKLKTDDSLKQKVEVCKSAKDLILQNKLKDLKAIMAEEQGKADNRGSFNKFWTIAIVASLIGSGTYFYLNSKSEPDNNLKKESIQENTKDISSKSTNKTAPVESSKNEGFIRSENSKIAEEKNTVQLSSPIEISDNKNVIKSNEEALKIPSDNTKTDVPVSNNDNITPTLPVDLCKGVKISAEIATHEPCNGGHDGFIELKDLAGGKAPYKSTLNGIHSETGNIFKELNPGNYKIEVIDNNGCKHQFNTLILKGRDCNLKYDFNPGRGEEWLGPIVEQASHLTILDKEGKTVISKTMKEGEQCTWNGYNQTGTPVLGYFVFVIENKDGKVTKGTITVTE